MPVDHPNGKDAPATEDSAVVAFLLSEGFYRRHSILYGAGVIFWALAVAFVPGEWSAFWPMMAWTIVYSFHFLAFKGTHVDPEWVEERVARLADEAKDYSHIEAIRGDYTSRERPGRPRDEGGSGG